jgi:ElaB/YqjD/DUF883 family membrane-anchored ribosome-binding protein
MTDGRPGRSIPEFEIPHSGNRSEISTSGFSNSGIGNLEFWNLELRNSKYRELPTMIDRIQPDVMGYGDQAEELKARALEYAETARARLTQGSEFVKDYVQKEPARALGIALGLGVALGWLIKRR